MTKTRNCSFPISFPPRTLMINNKSSYFYKVQQILNGYGLLLRKPVLLWISFKYFYFLGHVETHCFRKDIPKC